MSSPDAPIGKFEFVTISALRAAQLMRGCTPRVPPGLKLTTTARLEVAGGKVSSIQRPVVAPIVTPS